MIADRILEGRTRGTLHIPRYLIDGHRLELALDAQLIGLAHQDRCPQSLGQSLADKDAGAVVLGRTLKARGEVHAVADHRVLHALGRADVADDDPTHRDTDTDVDGHQPLFSATGVELIELDEHALCGQHRAVGIVLRLKRGAEQCHDGVADVLVEDALVTKDHIDHLGEVRVEHVHRAARTQGLRQRGEAADVREQDGDVLVLAAELVFAASE